MHDRPCYEVEFSDGTVIVADAEHQWRTIDAGRSDPASSVPVGDALGLGEDDIARVAARAADMVLLSRTAR